jgi:predicted nucleic acid-binding protein
MQVLVDTSVWIDYFKSGANSQALDGLLEQSLVVTNDVILAELVPFLKLRKQHSLVALLHDLPLLSLRIDWAVIVDWQTRCLTEGLNGMGIPDLLIAQNALQNNCAIYSLDKHFRLLNDVVNELKRFE